MTLRLDFGLGTELSRSGMVVMPSKLTSRLGFGLGIGSRRSGMPVEPWILTFRPGSGLGIKLGFPDVAAGLSRNKNRSVFTDGWRRERLARGLGVELNLGRFREGVASGPTTEG